METGCPASIVVADGVMVAGLGRNRGTNRTTITIPMTIMTAMKTFRRMLSNEGKKQPNQALRI